MEYMELIIEYIEGFEATSGNIMFVGGIFGMITITLLFIVSTLTMNQQKKRLLRKLKSNYTIED